MSANTSKYFYTDPFAAAWMNKKFGMVFQSFTSGGEKYTVFEIDEVGKIDTPCKYYIHPDSVKLLEPQVKDLVIVQLEGYYPTPTHFHSQEYWQYHPDTKLISIVQRNGIPFMWPEMEQV